MDLLEKSRDEKKYFINNFVFIFITSVI